MRTLETPSDNETEQEYVVYNPRPDKCERRRGLRYLLIGEVELLIEGKWWTGNLVDRSFVGFQVAFPSKSPLSTDQVLRMRTDSGECWVRVVYADGDEIAGLEWLEDADVVVVSRSSSLVTREVTMSSSSLDWVRIIGFIAFALVIFGSVWFGYVNSDSGIWKHVWSGFGR